MTPLATMAPATLRSVRRRAILLAIQRTGLSSRPWAQPDRKDRPVSPVPLDRPARQGLRVSVLQDQSDQLAQQGQPARPARQELQDQQDRLVQSACLGRVLGHRPRTMLYVMA